jgi:diguanylate cyclase (GGDEF)-like protein/putative nucleotidyltransferase with HDIG domain
VAFLFCDLDYLRDVNNNYGHLAGDKVLEQLSGLLLRSLPSTGTVSRFGGEEFVAMLPGVDPEEAFRMSERLRMAVSGQEFDIGTSTPIHVSICIGISSAPADGTNLTILTERADKALYAAKAAGRNRVCVWSESLDGSHPAVYGDRHQVVATTVAAPPLTPPAPQPAPRPAPPAVQPPARSPAFMAAATVSAVAVGAFLGYVAWGLSGLSTVLLVAAVAFLSVRIAMVGHVKALAEATLAHQQLDEQHQANCQMLEQWVNTMALLIDTREDHVPGHAEKVAHYAVALAGALGVPESGIEELRQAALLHDLGKLGVPERILNKPASLSPEEWRIMQDHAALGEQILSRISGFGRVGRIVGEHHEWYNGQGYPYGRSGADLTLGSRILAVADALDTMLSGRPYAAPRSPEEALAELRACAGQQFDPMVVETLGRLIEKDGARFLTAAPPVSESA